MCVREMTRAAINKDKAVIESTRCRKRLFALTDMPFAGNKRLVAARVQKLTQGYHARREFPLISTLTALLRGHDLRNTANPCIQWRDARQQHCAGRGAGR